MSLLTDPQAWIALAHPDRARDRARHRQHHLHLDPRRAAARTSSAAGRARLGLAAGDADPHRPAGLAWPGSPTSPRRCSPSSATTFTARDLVLIGGGLFLLAKATFEIHHNLEGEERAARPTARPRSFAAVIAQIMVLDIVFSLDSVITAIGMAEHLPVMIAAIVIAVR